MLGLRNVETMWGRPLLRSAEWERLRKRALAFTGLWVLLGGLVVSLGFGAFVLDATLVLVVVCAVAAVVLALRHGLARLPSRPALPRIGPAGRRLRAKVDELELPGRFERLAARSRNEGARAGKTGLATASVASRRAAVALDRSGRRSATVLRALGANAHLVIREGTAALSRLSDRSSAPPDRQRQAIRLNTLGAQLRREGKHERAAEQHRAALAIARDLGDEHTEALTLNNLALAVVHTDGIAAAVEHFEQALVVLRQLGDEEHEGRVIANLGFIHKSHGSSEEADGLLHAALDKLPADSTAYRRVEEQLRRAS